MFNWVFAGLSHSARTPVRLRAPHPLNAVKCEQNPLKYGMFFVDISQPLDKLFIWLVIGGVPVRDCLYVHVRTAKVSLPTHHPRAGA